MFGRALAWIGEQTQGTLLRRTIIHVVTFVVGSAMFVTLMSVVLVSVAKGVLPNHAEADKDDSDTPASTSKPTSRVKSPAKKPRAPSADDGASNAAGKDE